MLERSVNGCLPSIKQMTIFASPKAPCTSISK